VKRSEINLLTADASACFAQNGWTLPPNPHWDVTDFGLGGWRSFGLVLVNLADEPEYCEKLMYAKRGMVTPEHCHRKKKEDIICRTGVLHITVWHGEKFALKRNGVLVEVSSGETLVLQAGERVTLEPGVIHQFQPGSEACIIGEVSTANDDVNDNFFTNPAVGRFSEIDEDVV
jgi:D-lyxose ketol-isomerase